MGASEPLGRSWQGGVRLEALANVAHELRTPVQVLLGYLDLLRDDAAQALGGEARRIIERMGSNAHDLAQTVENILEFARGDAHAEVMVEENIVLAELLGEVACALEALNQGKGLEIRIELDPALHTIRSRRRPIRAILTNLAVNAVKFTSSGNVTIAIREAALVAGEGIELEVRDTGPGVSPELVDAAFEQFTQLSASSTRCYRGLGLGLPVVQRNIRALGGALELRTAPGQGSSFKATIPCAIVRPTARRMSVPAFAVFSAGSQSPMPVGMRASRLSAGRA